MQSREKDNLVFVRLFPNEDIHWQLRRVCKKHEVETAVVLSGLGQLKQFQLGYYKEKGNYRPQEFGKPHELLSLTGNISNQQGEYRLHLHAVLGDEGKSVVGGHLISGKVELTNEIVLLKIELKIKRILEDSTGLEGMFLEGEMMVM
jgi:predicted DNA-binding protein with PD1-like motif